MDHNELDINKRLIELKEIRKFKQQNEVSKNMDLLDVYWKKFQEDVALSPTVTFHLPKEFNFSDFIKVFSEVLKNNVFGLSQKGKNKIYIKDNDNYRLVKIEIKRGKVVFSLKVDKKNRGLSVPSREDALYALAHAVELFQKQYGAKYEPDVKSASEKQSAKTRQETFLEILKIAKSIEAFNDPLQTLETNAKNTKRKSDLPKIEREFQKIKDLAPEMIQKMKYNLNLIKIKFKIDPSSIDDKIKVFEERLQNIQKVISALKKAPLQEDTTLGVRRVKGGMPRPSRSLIASSASTPGSVTPRSSIQSTTPTTPNSVASRSLTLSDSEADSAASRSSRSAKPPPPVPTKPAQFRIKHFEHMISREKENKGIEHVTKKPSAQTRKKPEHALKRITAALQLHKKIDQTARRESHHRSATESELPKKTRPRKNTT